MPEDPFAQYAVSPSAAPASSSSSDPFAQYAVKTQPQSGPTPEAKPSEVDPFASYAVSPGNGQAQPPSAPQHTYEDPNKGWISRAWDWANTPITESVFGMPEDRQGAGGFERGVEHIASGLTSPLSILLTAATFGTGGFLESAGANLLKESGLFSAAEIADVAKSAEVAAKAGHDLRPIEPVINDALTAGGHDLDLLGRAREAFAPFNKDAELASEGVQKSLSEVGLNQTQREALTKGTMSAEERETIATANKGFSDEELKALGKTGETVEAAKAGFTPIKDAIESAGLNFDKYKEAQQYLEANKLSTTDLIGGNAMERGAFQIIRKIVPDLPVSSALQASKTANAVLNAGFTLQQLESAAAMSPRFLDALKEGDYDHAMEYGTEALAGGTLGILGASHALHSAGELFKPILGSTEVPKLSDQWLALDRANKEREANHVVGEAHAIAIDKQIRETLGHAPARAVLGDTKEVAAQKKLELASVLHQVVTGGDRTKAADWHNALAEAADRDDRLVTLYRVESANGSRPTETFTSDLSEARKQGWKPTDKITTTVVPENELPEADVAKNGSKSYALPKDTKTSEFSGESPVNGQLAEQIKSNNFSKLPKEYQDLVLDSMRRVAEGKLSDKELAAAKSLSEETNKNFEIGHNNNGLDSYVENYMTRLYKDENPEGKAIAAKAKSGGFATNVSMAKQRVYDSHLTAMLKSPKEQVLDPVSLTSQGRADTIKAAANRQLIDNLRDKFTRGSDGRPAVVISGSGKVVSGENGEDPKTFIDPNRVRNITVSPSVVESLTKSGELQRYLDDGNLRDITPYVQPENIRTAIARMEETYDKNSDEDIRPQINYLRTMLDSKDFSGLKEINDAMPKKYAWDPQDYISINNGAFKDWNFATNDPSGNKILVKGDIRVHPEFAEYLKNRLGLEESGIAKNPIGKALLTGGSKLKHTLLSLSPFHLVQEALRIVMIGGNPIGALKDAFHGTGPDILSGERIDPSDPNSPTIIYKGVEQGLTPGTDYKAEQEHSEGVSSGDPGLLSKIPGVGKTIANSMSWYQDFLFKRYIPALKARSMELMYHEYQRLHPEWSVDKIAKAAALHTNDAFGGINYRAMGRSATTQDWGRLLFLAPDWIEGELRSGARLFNKDDGGLGRAQVAKMSLALWGAARVLNTLTTGSPHLEAPFGLAVKNKEGKETVFSIRTLPTDLLHAASDPVGFVRGRLSPTIAMGTELVTGRDRQNRKLQPADLWVDVFRNMAPLPLQSLGQAMTSTGPEVGNVGQAWKSVGGTAQTYQSPAQKLAAEKSADRSESGPIDQTQMARHRTIMGFEDKVRSGEVPMTDIYKMYATGELHADDLKKITENLKATKELSAPMASLYTRASRLPGPDYLQLMDTMNPSEKDALKKLTQQVRKRYLAKAMKDLRPEERLRDPTFVRFLNLIPDQSPF